MPRSVDPDRRRLEPGWIDRHMLLLAEAPGAFTIPLRYEDGAPVLDRRGRAQVFSRAIAAARQPGQLRSREVQRRAAREAEAARIQAEAVALRGQVQPGFRPPPGKLFTVDTAACMLIGPAGGIGVSERLARTLAPLAVGGRHPIAALMAASAWQDEAALREALAGVSPKLAAVGLRTDRRKGVIRIARAQI